MHNLHTFKRRLGWFYTWRQQARKGKNPKIGRKRATVAPYFEKIRCKCATVAPYLAASSLRRSCASTVRCHRDNCNKCDNPAGTAMRVLPTSGGWYRHHTPTAGKAQPCIGGARPCAGHVLEQSPAQSKGPRPYGILGLRLRLMHIGRPLWTGLARHFVVHSRGDGLSSPWQSLSSPWQAFSVHFLLSRQAWMPFQLGRNCL
jgi:hypothetical protein